jgi:hypothetical protein
MIGQGASSAVQQQGVAARDKDIALCEYFILNPAVVGLPVCAESLEQ